MRQVTKADLLGFAPGAKSAPNLDNLAAALSAAMERFQINSPIRMRYFLAQLAHESAEFTKLEESLYYKDATRVAQIFKHGFDADRDKVVDPEEVIEAAKYCRKPEALANRAYADRNGNGNEASGDGWRYRGSGLIMTTFLYNFLVTSMAIFGDRRLVDRPELLRDNVSYVTPALAAAAFWDSKGLNALADKADFVGVCKAVQGDASTVKQRKAYLPALERVIP